MASFIRQGASVTASILETAAGALRKFAGMEEASAPPTQTTNRTTTATAERPEPATRTQAPSKPRPAAGTRTRIANPKAARKVRAREG
jgi:hypothetical protein